jgi:hypothetical protein
MNLIYDKINKAKREVIMNPRRTLPVIIACVFIFFSVYAIENQNPQWKGTIEEEAGVKVIKNPNEPLYGEIEFELEEDLSIGNEEDENYLFYRLRNIQVDADGNIYVLDSGNNRLQVFNKNGDYLRTIGKKGQGPGEFDTPSFMNLDKETGNILLTDRSMTVQIFDKEGQYIDKSIHLAVLLRDFYVDSDGCIWGKFVLPGMDENHSIKRVISTGEIEKTIAEIPYYTNRIKLSHSKAGYTANIGGYFFTHGYEYDLFISKIDNHTFIYGNSKEYELVVVDKTGKTLFRIRKDEAPEKITKNEEERIKIRISGEIAKRGYFEPDISIEFPDQKPYFFSILTDSRARIYVRKNPISRESDENHMYDMFSKDGYFLYRIIIPIFPDVIHKGYIYTRSENEETGEEFVKRYKIKNWDQIREQ